MAEEINIHVATDLNTDKLPIKTVNNISPDSNGNIEITNATDPNAVHKTGNETINGVKSFNDMIKATNGTVQVGVDTGYSVTFNYNGNIVSKQARGTYNIFLPDANGTLALTSDIDGKANDNNVVHKTGDETIAGNKTFTNQLYLGAGGGSYGLISAKDTNGILRLFGGTTPSNGANLDLYGEGLSSGCFSLRARTSDKIVGLDGKTDGTLKWNGKNVALDDNVVHISGNETITGNKTFSNVKTSSLLVNSDTFKHVASPSGAHYVHTLPKFDGELLGTTFVKTSNGWYRKHSDGFIEQFIYIDSTNSLSEMNVNFAIPFTTTNYHVSVIGSRTDSTDPSRTDDLIFTTCVKDKTYVNIYKFDGGENTYLTSMTVYVCGY